MNGVAATKHVKAKAVLAIVAGLLLLLIANSHPFTLPSHQPECVAHVHRGQGAPMEGRFSAASSSCTPR